MEHDLAIMLLTAHRLDYAKQTLATVLDHLHYEGGGIHVHIASDGDTDAYIRELGALVEGRIGKLPTVSNAQGLGYGASYNLGTQVCHQVADFVLPLEDDWELTRDLDVTPLVADLELGEPNYGCVRLGYIGFTDMLASHFTELNGRMYLELEYWSSEKHVFTGHPRLESVWWERRLGPWPEGLNPGNTELAVCGRLEARKGVLWPIDLIKSWGDLFAHIGSERSY